MLGSALEKVLSISSNVLPCANDDVAVTMSPLPTEPDVTSAANGKRQPYAFFRDTDILL